MRPGPACLTSLCIWEMTSGSLRRRLRGSMSLMRSRTCRRPTSFARSCTGSMSRSKYACGRERGTRGWYGCAVMSNQHVPPMHTFAQAGLVFMWWDLSYDCAICGTVENGTRAIITWQAQWALRGRTEVAGKHTSSETIVAPGGNWQGAVRWPVRLL